MISITYLNPLLVNTDQHWSLINIWLILTKIRFELNNVRPSPLLTNIRLANTHQNYAYFDNLIIWYWLDSTPYQQTYDNKYNINQQCIDRYKLPPHIGKSLDNDPNLVIVDHTLVNINQIYMLSFISDFFRINLTIYLSVIHNLRLIPEVLILLKIVKLV